MTNPTTTQAEAFQALYDHFNRELFGSTLAPCLLNFSRKSRALGFFAPERWSEHVSGEKIHEISINPSYLSESSPRETASTLVHEMVHLWQQEHGKPGKRGYHNREWARKMADVGLIASDTAAPGGKQTGTRMSHYIEEGGAFDAAWAARPLSAGELFPYQCRESKATTVRKKRSNASKTKHTCKGGCGLNVWGKPGIIVICGECTEPLIPVA